MRRHEYNKIYVTLDLIVAVSSHYIIDIFTIKNTDFKLGFD